MRSLISVQRPKLGWTLAACWSYATSDAGVLNLMPELLPNAGYLSAPVVPIEPLAYFLGCASAAL